MGKKKVAFLPAGRAWNLLRLELMWARKGGAFKRGLIVHLRIIPNYLKSLIIRSAGSSDRIYYAERQFSFDDSPAFDFKLHRPEPMRQPAAFDYNDDGDDDILFGNRGRKNGRGKEEEGYLFSGGGAGVAELTCEEEGEEEETIDSKAEEFIARFYEQMKLQRQDSWLQYNEMLNRSLC